MIKPIAVALILLTPSAYADVDLPAELKDKIEAVGINPVSAEKSPVSGIYSVFSKEGTSYVTSDGEYIFTGNLFKVKGTEVENTTDEFISKGMRSYIEKLDTITYKAPDEKYVIGVFTDITCGFCQKLHSDLQSYLDKGITIKFIAYPRAGMNSMIARNMASVWCADDKPAALTRAMKGDGLPEKQLNRPGFPGECFICELRLPDHRFRWKHNKLFLLLPEEYGPAFPAIVDCYTSPPT